MIEENKQDTKSLKNHMPELMKLLNIEVGDIVEVKNTTLRCNDLGDLVSLNGNYSSNVPNLILGMVSGKNSYRVFKVTDVTVYQ